jgi:uncharacterized protein YndB with AHSA1/START domain
MKELQFSIEIKASKEKVWNTLWTDKTFRDWANLIDEGTYMDGEMIEGKDVRFISSVNGYGVTSRIAKLVPFETVLFSHMSDTKESGTGRLGKMSGQAEQNLIIFQKQMELRH